MANKVTVKLSFNDDLRRLTIDSTAFSFQQLQETIRRLFALDEASFGRLVVKYLDDEDDLVTISSTEELAEAFSLSRNKQPPVLRLFLKEARKPEQEQQGEEGCHGRRHGQWGPRGGFGRPWWRRRNGCAARCPALQQQQAADTASLPKTRKVDEHTHELVLNENPYGHGHFECDVCHLAGVGASYHCAQCQFDAHVNCAAAKDAANPWQRRQQWFRLHKDAMKLMEGRAKEGIEKARSLLKEQVEISPFHRVTPLYNLACVEALLGNTDEALKYLQEAVAAGWSDVAHLKSDSDLESLRNHDGFKALVASLENDSSDDEIHVDISVHRKKEEKEQAKEEKKDEKPSTPTTAPATVPLVPLAPIFFRPSAPPAAPAEISASAPAAPAAPAAVPNAVAEFDEKLRILDEMGWTDRRRNISALVFNRGDLAAAVQYLLDGSVGAGRQ